MFRGLDFGGGARAIVDADCPSRSSQNVASILTTAKYSARSATVQGMDGSASEGSPQTLRSVSDNQVFVVCAKAKVLELLDFGPRVID